MINKEKKKEETKNENMANEEMKNGATSRNINYNDLLEKLIDYSRKNIVPMHMPGAKRNNELIKKYMPDMPDPYDIDITEIDGFDNMHNAEGIIKKAFERTAALYGADESLFLVNGSTAGNMAAICGVTDKGDSVIVARNCHISVYNAIILNELDAIYVYPQYDEEYGYYKGISLDEIKSAVENNKNKDVKAVIITSPTYEGNISDIKNISEYLHAHNIPLIVDEAHGAHFRFSSEFPQTAVEAGADIVINSVHKTLPSLTQTAVMHINYGIVNVRKIKRYWNIYQSTSPSYILMGSIDRCMSIMEKHGEYLFEKYIDRLKKLRKSLSNLKNIKIINSDDISKIVIRCSDAKKLYDVLLNKYGIQLEMSSIKYAIAMTSLFDSQEYYDRLYNALNEIDDKYFDIITEYKEDESYCKSNYESDCNSCNESYHKIYYINNKYDKSNYTAELKKNINIANFNNECAMSIAQAIKNGDDNGYDIIMMNDSSLYGRISAKMVYVYPPGIPILCPGEIISENVVNIIDKAMKTGLEVVGIELCRNHNSDKHSKTEAHEDKEKCVLEYQENDKKNNTSEYMKEDKGAFVCLK